MRDISGDLGSLDFPSLETLAEVVELGSFTAAARRRGVSQPAVSMQVRQLERRLGVRLLERLGRGVTPTAAGQELLVHFRAAKAELSRGLAAVASHQSGGAGRVRIGTGATACIYLLPPLLRALRRAMPGLSIVVQTGNTADILRLIGENALDVGLLTLPAGGRAFSVEPVCRDPLLLVEAADAPVLPSPPPAILAREPLVLYEPGGNTRGIVDAWFAAASLSPRPLMQLGSVEAIKELVGAGLGCSILPAPALTRPAAETRLRSRPLVPPLERSLGIVLRRDKILDRGLREAVQALRLLRAQ
ncbi:LysR family transcriptional regulator [Enterovirga aerilata]|uniref:LysR family transcriptional regulator n=1 Tax=Enterovirga aerilata TaxID=2730920 RepID=A0A849HWY0_9HYPH|nr:LysR family transcriptional regulator [Enterovirga sp. DB1703]NNM72046.1 LysR family transcriptional regulator [Enterovirga sp. DB1703]